MSDILEQVEQVANAAGHEAPLEEALAELERILAAGPFPPAGVPDLGRIPDDQRAAWAAVGSQLAEDIRSLAVELRQRHACGCPNCLTAGVVLSSAMRQTSQLLMLLRRRLEARDD